MVLSWEEYTKTDGFQNLSVEHKKLASDQYFQQVVMPKLGKQYDIKNPNVLAGAYSQFQQEAVKPTLIDPPNQFLKSLGNKYAEQATGGIIDTQEGTDWLGSTAGALLGGATNVGAGMAIGGAIGSVVPVLGTAVGAGIGGTLGAVAGGFGQSLRERQNEGKTFDQLDAGDYGRAILEGGINAVPVVGIGAKPITKLATGALFDAGLNAGANALGQQVQKGEIDGMEVLQQGAFGAGGHLAGGIINKFFQKRALKAEAQAQAQEALQGVDASQVGVLPQDGTPNVRTDLTDVFPYQEDAPFDVQGFNQDRTAQIQTDLQAKIQEAVTLKAQGSHNEAKLIRASLSKQMNTLAKNDDPLARDFAKALDQIDTQAKALKQGKPPQDIIPQDSFDPNTAEIGETRIDPNTGETVYYGGEITNNPNAPDLPDPFFTEELQRREKVNTLEPIGTPVKPKILKGDFEKVTLKDIEDVLGDQLAPSSNVGQSYAVDTLKSLGYKVDKLKASAKGVDSRAGENYRVKVAGKNIIFKGQDPFATVTNRLSKEHGINISSSIAKRISKDKNFDALNELVLMNDDELDQQYSEGQGTASQAFQAFQEKLSGNQGAERDFQSNKSFAIQEAKTQELLNDLDKAHTPQHLAEIEQRYQDVLNTSIYPEYTQEIITPKLEETQVLIEGFTPLNKGKQEQLRARLERDLNQAQTPEDIARVADELYSDNTAKALVDEASFYEPLGAKLQEAEARVNDPNRATSAENAQVRSKTEPTEPLPLKKGGTATSQSGAGSPQARLDGKAQELGYQHIKHLMQGYKAIGGDLTPAKLKAVLEAKPELQAVADSFKPLIGKTHPDGTPKYPEEIEFQEAMREIARTPERYLDYESGTGRQQSVKELANKAPQDWNTIEQVKKDPAYDLASNATKKRVELIDRLMKQHKTMDVEIATEGGMSGKGGATNAIDAKKRQNITPLSFAIHNDQIAVNAYNADGHFAKYYIDLDPRLVKEGKEASRFLNDPVESTAPEFVGTYPNVYRDAIPFLLEDVLNRKPREEGILTSQARDVLDTARAFKSKLNKEQQLQIKYGANIKDIKKIQHELMKLNAPENVKKLTDAILNKAGNKKKLTANDIIAIKKTLEKEPTLKALKGMCDLFKLSTANLE
jgi:hypothetical protein